MKSKTSELYINNVNENKNGKEVNTGVRLDEKRCLTVSEFQAYCGIGRNNALKLIKLSHSSLRIGKKILVDRILFDKWLNEKEKKNKGKQEITLL